MYGEQSTGAGLIISDTDGFILLVRGSDTGKWSFPKGQAESIDNNRLATAIRECYEEIGLQAGKHYTVLDDEPFMCFDRTYFFAYLYSGSEKDIELRRNEVNDYRWINPSKSCHFWNQLNIGVRTYIKMTQQLN